MNSSLAISILINCPNCLVTCIIEAIRLVFLKKSIRTIPFVHESLIIRLIENDVTAVVWHLCWVNGLPSRPDQVLRLLLLLLLCVAIVVFAQDRRVRPLDLAVVVDHNITIDLNLAVLLL